jgi:hypothetical protein
MLNFNIILMADSRDNKLLNIKIEEDINRIEILDKFFNKFTESEISISNVIKILVKKGQMLLKK